MLERNSLLSEAFQAKCNRLLDVIGGSDDRYRWYVQFYAPLML